MGNDHCCNRNLLYNEEGEFKKMKDLNLFQNYYNNIVQEEELKLQLEFEKDLPDPYKSLNNQSKRVIKLYRQKKQDNKEEFILKIQNYDEMESSSDVVTLIIDTYSSTNSPIYKWRIEDVIGDINFPEHTYFKAYEKNSKIPFALKILSFKEYDSQEFKQALYHLYILKHIQQFAGTHKNIQQLYESFIIDNGMNKVKVLVLVMEFCDCNLFDIIKYRHLNSLEWIENNLLKIFQDMISSLNIIHNLNIAHRDINLENIRFSVYDNQYKISGFDAAILINLKALQSSFIQNSSFISQQSPVKNKGLSFLQPQRIQPLHYSDYQQQKNQLASQLLHSQNIQSLNNSTIENAPEYQSLLNQAISQQNLINQNLLYYQQQQLLSNSFSNDKNLIIQQQQSLQPQFLINTARCKPIYMSPELFDQYKIEPASQIYTYNPFLLDIYSLAVAFYSMLVLEVKPNTRHLKKLAEYTNQLNMQKGFIFGQKQSKEIIGRMAQQDPSRRPLTSELLKLFQINKFFKNSQDSSTVQIFVAKMKNELSTIQKLQIKEKIAVGYAALLQGNDSLEIYQDLLQFFEINNDEENKAQTLIQMGLVAAESGQQQESNSYLQRGVKIVLDLARMYRKAGNYQQSIKFFIQALEIYRKPFMSEQIVEMTSILESIGNGYRYLGEFDKAKEYQEEAVQLLMKTIGKNSIEVAKALNNLGNVYACIGDFNKAEDKLIQCVNIVKNFFPNQKKGLLAMSYSNLGEVYRYKGNLEMAKKCLLDALIIEKELYGKQHIEVASTKENLGNVFYDLSDFQTAKRYYEKALIIKKNQLGDFHSDLSISLNNLGNVCRNLQLYDDAKMYYEEALEINRRNFGENHPNTAISLGNLALNLNDMGQKNSAKNMLLNVLQTLEQKQGIDHPDYILFKNQFDSL